MYFNKITPLPDNSESEVTAKNSEVPQDSESTIKYRLQLGQRYYIGRSESNEICLKEDRTVSRKHCYIDIDHRGRCVIQDLGATAGTILNGSKIRRACLLIDDKIVCGRTTLQLYQKKRKRGMFNLLSLLAADSGNYESRLGEQDGNGLD